MMNWHKLQPLDRNLMCGGEKRLMTMIDLADRIYAQKPLVSFLVKFE